MKTILIALLFSALVPLYSVTLEVNLDGSADYTSIQAAIDASSPGDVVLVHPGRYYENVDWDGHHNLTVASLNYTTDDPQYIHSTIIDGGHLAHCVRIKSDEQGAVLHGFTLENGGQELDPTPNSNGIWGPGIRIGSPTGYLAEELSVYNCVVKNNTGSLGGGICNDEGHLYLSGVSIHNNAGDSGGGLVSMRGSLTFDPVNKCSIYNNNAADNTDIFLIWSTDIILDTLTVVLDAPDNFFVTADNSTLSVDHGFMEQIDSDLWIAPDGNDDNTGTSPDDPLQTIDYAMKRIYSDSLTYHTVYMAPGVYSRSLNNQRFPTSVRQFVSLIGAGVGETIIDGEEQKLRIGMSNPTHGTVVSDFTIQNAFNDVFGLMGFPYGSCDVTVRNLELKDSTGDRMVACAISNHDGISFDNILISNLTNESNPLGFDVLYSNIHIQNVVLDNLQQTQLGGFGVSGVYLMSCNATVDRMIISNNRSVEFGVFHFGNGEEFGDPDNQLTLTNSLFYNNDCDWGDSGMGYANIANHFDQPSIIRNCTFANNYGSAPRGLSLTGPAIVENNILWNPMSDFELFLSDYNENTVVEADYNDIRGGLSNVATSGADPQLVWGDGNIDADPMFMGGDPYSYRLSEGSPCIDAGTPDTLGLGIPDRDLANAYRVWNGRIDIGCYEHGSTDTGDDGQVPPPQENTLTSYPNPVFLSGENVRGPFPLATFEFDLVKPIRDRATIEVFNIKGQRVQTLEITTNIYAMAASAGIDTGGKFSPTNYTTTWNLRDNNGRKIPCGVYVYRLIADGNFVAARKMMVMR